MIVDIISDNENIKTAWVIFYALTALAGWVIKESIRRKEMLRTMTRAHIAWHTVPAWGLIVGGGLLAAMTSQLIVTGHISSSANWYMAGLIVWGLSIGAYIAHVMMESVPFFNKHLFKINKD